jgi:hypothetical protein
MRKNAHGYGGNRRTGLSRVPTQIFVIKNPASSGGTLEQPSGDQVVNLINLRVNIVQSLQTI